MTRIDRLAFALLLVCGLLAGVRGVAAQAFPSRPIVLVVPFAQGAANDVLARTLANEMKETLGSVLVENRPGADGNIGADFVRRSAADGHTLLITASQLVIVAAMGRQPFDIVADFAPVVLTNILPFFLVINQEAIPARSVREVIEFARTRPGKLSYASAGNGSPHHFAMELFKLQTGIDVVHVPYKGMGQGVVDLLAGRTQMTITGFPAVANHMKSGKLRLLAHAGGTRTQVMPEAPTIAESGVPGFDMTSWQGVLAPAATPKAVIAKLNAEFNRVNRLARVRESLLAQGMDLAGGTPEEFGARIRSDLDKYARVVKAAGIRAD